MSDDAHDRVLDLLGERAERGLVLPDGSHAWTRLQCLEILDALASTTVAILAGEFFRQETDGLVPARGGWVCERAPGETATDFAIRSRELARSKCAVEEQADLRVVLTFSDQHRAA